MIVGDRWRQHCLRTCAAWWEDSSWDSLQLSLPPRAHTESGFSVSTSDRVVSTLSVMQHWRAQQTPDELGMNSALNLCVRLWSAYMRVQGSQSRGAMQAYTAWERLDALVPSPGLRNLGGLTLPFTHVHFWTAARAMS